MDVNRRVETLRNARPNRWVVLSEDGGSILVEGEDFAEVAAAVEERGLSDAVLVFVPPDWGPRILQIMTGALPLRAVSAGSP
jgi:hypothetical protein